MGTKPIPSSWKKWEFSLLEPPNLPKRTSGNAAGSEEAVPTAPKSTSFNLDGLVEEARNKLVCEEQSARKLSLSEVKKVLSGSKEGLVSLIRQKQPTEQPDLEDSVEGGGLVPSVSEEKKICLVIEQFSSLEKDILSKAPKKTDENRLNPDTARVSIQSSEASVKKSLSLTRENLSKQQQQQQRQQSVRKIPKQPSTNFGATTATKTEKLPTRVTLKESRPTSPASSMESSVRPPSSKLSSRSTLLASTDRQKITSANKKGQGRPAAQPAAASAAAATTGKKKSVAELKKMFRSKQRQSGVSGGASGSSNDEPVTVKGPEFEHSMFNLFGHSPLVRHYMDTRRLAHHVNEKEVVVGRTEIAAAEESQRDAVCYRDVLAQSLAAAKRNRALFQR